MAFHVSAPVMARTAVALVNPALRHNLARMPRRLFLAHLPCVRRPGMDRDCGSRPGMPGPAWGRTLER